MLAALTDFRALIAEVIAVPVLYVGTIALGRWAVESGRVAAVEPETRFVLQCPCGPVAVAATAPLARWGG